MPKIPEPGLPEIRRIRELENTLKILLRYLKPGCEGAKKAVFEAKKLLEK